MNVRIADMAEDHVVERVLPQLRVIVGQHFAVARERDGIIGAKFQESPAAHGVVHQFRQRVAEAAETLAILIARGEPTVVGRMIGPEIDIAVFLLDQQRRRRRGREFRG